MAITHDPAAGPPARPLRPSAGVTNRTTPYVVQYRRVADPRHISAILYAWAIVTGPYTVFRVVVVNWGQPAWAGGLPPDIFRSFPIGTFIVTSRRLQVPVHRPVDLTRYAVDCLIPTHREMVPLIEPTILAAIRVRAAATFPRRAGAGVRDREVGGDIGRRNVYVPLSGLRGMGCRSLCVAAVQLRPRDCRDRTATSVGEHRADGA